MKTNFFVISYQWFKSPVSNGFGNTTCQTSKPVELLDYEQVKATIEYSLRDPDNPDAPVTTQYVLMNIVPMAPVDNAPAEKEASDP